MQDITRTAAAESGASGPAGAPNANDVFMGALRQLHTVPHLASSAKEAVDALREILAEADPKSVVVAGLPTAARMLVEAALKGVKHRFVEELDASEAVGVISKADVGITWAQFGAARQGCIVEVAYDDAIKLASSLPRLHVALISSRDLLPDFSDAVARIAELLRDDSRETRKPVVSIISGPSKTADIEMRLVYGVHGPHALHVILLDWL
jgi:L-lactate dehydrogenase complex protein LldG